MKIIDKYLRVTMSDGSRWDVPVAIIAHHRAKFFTSEFGSLDKSLREDTLPLFEEDQDEITDWAANNMNWADVESCAVKVIEEKQTIDFQEGWINGEQEIVSHA